MLLLGIKVSLQIYKLFRIQKVIKLAAAPKQTSVLTPCTRSHLVIISCTQESPFFLGLSPSMSSLLVGAITRIVHGNMKNIPRLEQSSQFRSADDSMYHAEIKLFIGVPNDIYLYFTK